MKTIYEKGSVKITDNNKCYVLVYEKEFSQGSSSQSDELEELSINEYANKYEYVDNNILLADDGSERENEDDEYSIWYTKNVKYSHNELFGIDTVTADFNDYVESVRVIEFDINFEDFKAEDIVDVYVSKHNSNRFVSDRKKELVIKTVDDEFRFSY